MSDKPKLIDRFKQSKFAEFMRDKVKPIAGDIVEIVGDVTGVDAIERVGQLLNQGKENREELKALDAEFQKFEMTWKQEMIKIEHDFEIEQLRIEIQDRDSARNREIAFMNANGGKRDWLMGIVVITGLILTCGVVAALIFWKVPEENQRLADMCFGSILSIGASIFAYYVGSSKSSRHKDETIAKAMR